MIERIKVGDHLVATRDYDELDAELRMGIPYEVEGNDYELYVEDDLGDKLHIRLSGSYDYEVYSLMQKGVLIHLPKLESGTQLVALMDSSLGGITEGKEYEILTDHSDSKYILNDVNEVKYLGASLSSMFIDGIFDESSIVTANKSTDEEGGEDSKLSQTIKELDARILQVEREITALRKGEIRWV